MGRECHGSDASFPGRCRGSPGVTGGRVSGFPQRRVAGFRCVINARAAWRSRDDANAPFPWPSSPLPPLGNHQLILRACGAVSLRFVRLFWAAFSDPPVREVIQCLSCPARPVSLSVRLSGSIHGAAKRLCPLCPAAEGRPLVCVTRVFMRSPRVGSGGFHLSAVTRNAAMNIGRVYLFQLVFVFFGYKPRKGTAAPSGFFEDPPDGFPRGGPRPQSRRQCARAPFAPHPPQPLFAGVSLTAIRTGV